MRTWTLVAACALVAAPALAVDANGSAAFGTPIDLTAFSRMEGLDDLVEPVGLVQGDDGARRRFYVAPIIGASWGQLIVDGVSTGNPSLFTAGGAAGVAFTRPLGQLRMEFEGRYRDSYMTNVGALAVGAGSNWSALFNIWRDFSVTEKLGVYGGGGVGGGGYRFIYSGSGEDFVNGPRGLFAWQAGGGVIYAVSDRVTLDVGYRYYGTGIGRGCDCPEAAVLQNQFIASEMLFAVRIYEPFRGLRR